ncbi:MAG: Adenylate cyclase [Bradyrhizobium sp.]|nr:Adenylate cyclase [Bradyrhizobium sp.]
MQLFLGDGDAAIEQFQIGLRMSPLDPRIFMAQHGMATAHSWVVANDPKGDIREGERFDVAGRTKKKPAESRSLPWHGRS